MIRRIVMATGNPGKYTEIRAVMAGLPVEWVPGNDFPVGSVAETGDTYAENALIKARAFADIAGLPALADDSGLEVDCLNGLPGVHSNRYFGENLSDGEKVRHLLDRMTGIPMAERTARFRCTAVLFADGEPVATRTGAVEGVILTEPRGTGGFGYDPVFFLPELERTFAELDREIKNRLSHRGRAMRLIREFLLHRYLVHGN